MMPLPYKTFHNLAESYLERCAEVQRQANLNPYQHLKETQSAVILVEDEPPNLVINSISSSSYFQPLCSTDYNLSQINETGVEMLKEWIDVSELNYVKPSELKTQRNYNEDYALMDSDVEIIEENDLHWADINVEEFLDPEEQNDIRKRREAEEKHLQTNGKFKCDHCPYKTDWKSNLSKHTISRHKTSSEIKWYKCTKCSYQGKTKEYLRTHLRTHLQTINEDLIQWYHCAKCPSKYKNKQTLKTHMICLHSNPDEIKWYKCDKCDYKFKFNSRLRKHILCAHTENNKIPWYRCEKCNYKGKTKKGLKRHIYNKHTEKITYFKCNFCEFQTTLTKYLKQHIRNRHFNEDQGNYGYFEDKITEKIT